VNGIPAKVAEEVGVLFEDFDPAPGAGEEKPGHDSGGTSASDHQIEG
jgi:hypothetical protein